MGDPIVIRNPIITLTELVAGVPTGAAVDVSEDTSKVELAPTVPTSQVQTFAGKFTQAGDVEWAGTISIVVNEDTSDNWAPLVGSRVRAKVYDRSDLTWYREFDTEVLFDPGLGGPTQPGQARAFDMVLPVLSQPTLVTPP